MGWLGVPSPSTHELHLALAYSLSSPVDSCVTWTRACNHLASWLIEAEMGTWLFKVLTISPPCSTTFHGSPLPSRGMQAWHSRLLTRLPHLSQLLLVLSTPQHFWIFRGSAKQLPTSKQPEISFLTLSAFQAPTHPSGSSSSVPSTWILLGKPRGEAMFPAVCSCSPEIFANCVVATCLMLPAKSGQDRAWGWAISVSQSPA